MIPVEEARRRILASFSALPAEVVPLTEAFGRVLAEDLTARVTQPSADISAMDGYAVRAADVSSVPTVLSEIGAVPAGASFDGVVGPGQCVRIFTGAPLPDGTDAIVIQEDTERDGTRITVRQSVAVERHVRKAGLDFRGGDALLKAGRWLTARDIGLAAAMNRPWLAVRRQPRVAILATGDEVVLPGEPMGPNQIASANGPALAAMIAACGGAPVTLGIAADDADRLAAMADQAIGADLLITTGGASVGEHDLVRSALGAHGLVLDFWKIAMRPGKPLMFGRLRDTPLLGLPGNPVSAMVCAILFARPIMQALLGQVTDGPETEPAVLGADLKANDRRQDFVRAALARRADGQWVATPMAIQDSSMMVPLAESDCLLVRPPHAPAAVAGDPVDVIRFATLLGI